MLCRICHSESDTFPTYKINDKMFKGNEFFEYFECTECGTLQISVIPTEMSQFYPDNYYSFQSRISFKDKLIFRIRDFIFYYNYPKFLQKKLSVKIPNLALEAFLKLKFPKNIRLLDVGCGEGKFLKSIYFLGYKNIVGIEPFALHTQTKPFPIIRKNMNEINGKFDVITFNHVLEHIEDIHKTLQNCRELLSKSGTIIIRVPVKDSYAFDFYRENWVQWDAPRHLQLLTKKSFELICEKNGCDLKDYYCDSYKFQFTGSEKYKLGFSYQTSNNIFGKKELKNFTKKAIDLNRENRGDQIVAVLELKNFDSKT